MPRRWTATSLLHGSMLSRSGGRVYGERGAAGVGKGKGQPRRRPTYLRLSMAAAHSGSGTCRTHDTCVRLRHTGTAYDGDVSVTASEFKLQADIVAR